MVVGIVGIYWPVKYKYNRPNSAIIFQQILLRQHRQAHQLSIHMLINHGRLPAIPSLYQLIPGASGRILTHLNPTVWIKHGFVKATQQDPWVGVSAYIPSFSSTIKPHWHYQGAVQFAQLTTKAWQHYPGIQGLNGQLHWQPASSLLQLSSGPVVIDTAGLFPAPLALQQIKAQVTWQPLKQQLTISTLHLRNKQIQLEGALQLTHTNTENNKKSWFINSTASLRLAHPQLINAYLPVGIMRQKTITWLRQAFVRGDGVSAQLALRGQLAHFPFDQYPGQFRVQTHLTNTTLRFSSHWPVISHFYGEVDFVKQIMQIKHATAMIYGQNIPDVSAFIDDLRPHHPAMLTVDGQVRGVLQKGLDFLTHSPLKAQVGRQVAGLIAKGPLQLHLNLAIPLTENKPTKLKGELQLQHNSLIIPATLSAKPLQLNQLNGLLSFDNKTLSSPHVNARFLTRPLSIKVKTVYHKKTPSICYIQFQGNQQLSALARQFSLPIAQILQGSSLMQGKLSIPLSGQQGPSLAIQSTLQGVQIQLPKPFTKQSQQRRQLTLELAFKPTGLIPLQLHYGNLLQGQLYLKHEDWHLVGGYLYFGSRATKSAIDGMSLTKGLYLDGRVNSLNLKKWRDLYQRQVVSHQANTKLVAAAKRIKKINLHINELHIHQRLIHDLWLQASPDKHGWQLVLQNKKIKGQLQFPIPLNQQIIKAHFTRLYLRKHTSHQQLVMKDFPNLDFVSDDFRYGNYQLGKLQFQLRRQKHQVNINHLQIRQHNWQFNGAVHWQDKSTGDFSDVSGRLTTKNMADTLQAFGAKPGITSGHGQVDIALAWKGAPVDWTPKSLSGEIKLNLQQGVIANIGQGAQSKVGAGRLLNFLSIANLQKRLTLDFSDLNQKGLGFNKLTGKFKLTQGNASSNNVLLDGSVAHIVFAGRIGFVAHDFDANLKVTPHVTASLPILATITGGPLAGVVTWLASKVMAPAVNQITTNHYHLTGTWKKPILNKTATTTMTEDGVEVTDHD